MAFCINCTCYKCVRRRSGRCIDCGNPSGKEIRCRPCGLKVSTKWWMNWYNRTGKQQKYEREEAREKR